VLPKLQLISHLLQCRDAADDNEHHWQQYEHILKQYEDTHRNETEAAFSPDYVQEAVTVEDLSHMLIFLQNITSDELHDLLDYMQEPFFYSKRADFGPPSPSPRDRDCRDQALVLEKICVYRDLKISIIDSLF